MPCVKKIIINHQFYSPNLMQLFKMFDTPPTKISSSSNSPSTAPSPFGRVGNSGEKSSDEKQYLNVISPFSPSLQFSEEAHTLTDRYIPSRKLLKKDSFFQQQQEKDSVEYGSIKPEISVAEVYKKYIMTERNHQCKEETLFQAFQNNNILKYSNKSPPPDLDSPLLIKNPSLQFTEDLIVTANSKRKISKLPCKVLDAPALQDDYYLNLIDWSTQNCLAVGLSSSVYLWNAENSKVTKLCDLGMTDTITSVSWSLKDPHFSLGTNNGEVQIWDVNKMEKTRTMNGHSNRVGTIAWNSTIFSTGSRDKTILHRDMRINSPFFSKSTGHKQEICGLKWAFDEQQFCSGGNDNQLLIWNPQMPEPIVKYTDHTAAIKAMAWSPHEHGLLVSGGGTADRTIKFRKTLTGQTIKSIDTGSQVCNLMFSKTVNQIVSTHGYSQNQINIWKYPKMQKIATLTGHTHRVLYLAMSPDGTTIVTGAGDETLRFWNVFPHRNVSHKNSNSLLNTDTMMIR